MAFLILITRVLQPIDSSYSMYSKQTIWGEPGETSAPGLGPTDSALNELIKSNPDQIFIANDINNQDLNISFERLVECFGCYSIQRV